MIDVERIGGDTIRKIIALVLPLICLSLVTVTSNAVATIEAFSVTFEPKCMDLYDPDDVVTARMRFKAAKGEDQRVVEINTSTVFLETVPAIEDSNYTSTQPPEYFCDFDGEEVRDVLDTKIRDMPYNPQGNYVVDLTITGKLYDGTPFTGTGHIQVKGRYLSGSPPPPPQ